VLAALGARIRFRLAADVTLATFFVSHLTPFGSATGTLVNASTLESEGIPAATTGEAIALTSLMSTVALIILFGAGFAATAGRHVSHQYLVIAGIALALIVAVLAAVLAVGAHPAVAGRAGRWAATVARHVRPGIDPVKVGQTSSRLASLARTALTGRAAAVSFGFASGDLLFDLLLPPIASARPLDTTSPRPTLVPSPWRPSRWKGRNACLRLASGRPFP
jgi:uncharacterized membrane protein YbhN (UPF0104 family)